MALEKLPWLDYSGQTATELIACKSSHRIDSLLCAFEEGIQNKRDQQGSVTDEERLVLAVMALEREVNNGGHYQFFVNSSRQFAPIIQKSLLRIHCDATAAIVGDAIAALGLPVFSEEAVSTAIHAEDAVRDQILDDCDQRFYKLHEIEPSLFSFVEAHQNHIQLAKALVTPRRPEASTFPNVSSLYAHLLCSKSTDHSLEGARRLAHDLAQGQSIPATQVELEGAAVLYAFHHALKAGDPAGCEPLARRAFELMREETIQSVLHRKWVNQLIAASQDALADASTLTYLEYLKGSDQSTRSTQNRVKFWAAPLQEHPASLPNSVQFFTTNFPDIGLDKPLPGLRFIARNRSTARSLSRKANKDSS
jgi:Domain of unknown function (DUF4375)